MTLTPRSVEELQEAVRSHPSVGVRGGGTKTGLARAGAAVTIATTALDGLTEYVPEEGTFTARAGTPLVEIASRLAAHGQYLPFDPPLARAGGTIGGAVAAGVSGSGRYHYGGIRDFIIGASIVDGEGRLLRSGGKVVKNAAGFLLHQALVGSAGRLGILTEITFKVFPAPEALGTVRFACGGLDAALSAMTAIRRSRLELDALDLEAPDVVWARVGGIAANLRARLDAIARLAPAGTDRLEGADDEAAWTEAGELAWVPAGHAAVRVPIVPSAIAALDASLAEGGARRRYAVGGSLAIISWPGPLDDLSTRLARLGLAGQVVLGPPGRPFIGAWTPGPFEARVRAVLDPSGRFADARSAA